MQPDRTISNGPINGYKKAKGRIMFVSCTNTDGSDKRNVNLVGKSADP
jgi:hypothetical protein